MPTARQIEEIQSICNTYVDSIAPLIKDLEYVQGVDAAPLYNEVRAMMGHLSRCYQTGRRISATDEIKKALGHLNRLTLDVYKIYALYFSDIEAQYEKDYKWVNLSTVDHHSFYEKYFEYSYQGKMHLIEARKQESLDKKAALLAYEKMYVCYHNMVEYMHHHSAEMSVQRKKYIVCKCFSVAAIFISTVLATVICHIAVFLIIGE